MGVKSASLICLNSDEPTGCLLLRVAECALWSTRHSPRSTHPRRYDPIRPAQRFKRVVEFDKPILQRVRLHQTDEILERAIAFDSQGGKMRRGTVDKIRVVRRLGTEKRQSGKSGAGAVP